MMVNKIDIAKEQLRLSILLYFKDESPISIHTLSHASLEILQKTVEHYCGIRNTSIHKNLMGLVRPEKQKEWYDKAHEHKNYFKHTSRNPYETTDFNDENNVFVLFDCIIQLNILKTNNVLGAEWGVYESVFFVHLYKIFPDFFTENLEEEEFIKKIKNLNIYNEMSDKEICLRVLNMQSNLD